MKNKKLLLMLLVLALLFQFGSVYGDSYSSSDRDIKVWLKGNYIFSDAKPMIKKDRTYVPIRFIAEELGFDVNYLSSTRQVLMKRGDQTLAMQIGSVNAVFNGKEFQFEEPVFISSDRTYVPLRFISERFNENVDYDSQTKTAIIGDDFDVDGHYPFKYFRGNDEVYLSRSNINFLDNTIFNNGSLEYLFDETNLLYVVYSISESTLNDGVFDVDAYIHSMAAGNAKKYPPELKYKINNILNYGTPLSQYLAYGLAYGETEMVIDKKYTNDEVWAALNEANYQNPIILENVNIECYLTRYTDYSKLEVHYIYSDLDERIRVQQETFNKADQILAELSIDPDDVYVEDVYNINNYICNHTYYDDEAASFSTDLRSQPLDIRKSYMLLGPMFEGKAVCTGYAETFQFLLNYLNIACLYDRGKADEIHAWNLVQAGEDKEWYLVDVTWNDREDGDALRGVNPYLMIPKQLSDRSRESDKTSFVQSGYYGNLKMADDYDYDYMNYVGMSADSSGLGELYTEYYKKNYVPRFVRCNDNIDRDILKKEFQEYTDYIVSSGNGLYYTYTWDGDYYSSNLIRMKDVEYEGKAVSFTNLGFLELE